MRVDAISAHATDSGLTSGLHDPSEWGVESCVLGVTDVTRRRVDLDKEVSDGRPMLTHRPSR
jgi:hypothetical protein